MVRETLDELAYIWRRRATFRGLVLFLLLVNLVMLPAVVSISYFTLDRAGALKETSSFLTFLAGSAACAAVANLLTFAAWIRWRRIPAQQLGRITVLFAPQPASETEDLIYSLYDQFKADLRARGLAKVVTHSLVPSDRAIVRHEDATKLIAETGAHVVIFGSVAKGQVAGKELEGFQSISFTVRHPPLEISELAPLTETLVGALVLRNYAISNENSFIDRNVVVTNISEVARFFIAVSLTLEGNVRLATPLLEQLLTEVEDKLLNQPATPQLEFFRRSIRRALHAATLAHFNVVYEQKFLSHIGLRSGDEAAEECLRIVERLEQITGEVDRFALTRAVFSFHYGRIDEARALVKQSQRVVAVNDSAPYISLAFLALWDENYGEALKQYLRARRSDLYDFTMITNVLAFLENVIENNPGKKQLRFGLAFLNDTFFDPTVARREYADFLAATEGDSRLDLLRGQASARIRVIDSGHA